MLLDVSRFKTRVAHHFIFGDYCYIVNFGEGRTILKTKIIASVLVFLLFVWLAKLWQQAIDANQYIPLTSEQKAEARTLFESFDTSSPINRLALEQLEDARILRFCINDLNKQETREDRACVIFTRFVYSDGIMYRLVIGDLLKRNNRLQLRPSIHVYKTPDNKDGVLVGEVYVVTDKSMVRHPVVDGVTRMDQFFIDLFEEEDKREKITAEALSKLR